MADIRINQLPEETSPVATENVAIDGSSTRRTTIQKMVDAGAPLASQAEAEAGVNAVKRMSPLTTAQAIAALAAPLAHVGSRNGHPLATTALDGLMAGADKLYLDLVKSYAVRPECVTGGVTDNREIIQDAIDLAISSGRNSVFLPPGRFALSDFLLLNSSNFHFIGSGRGVTELVMTAAEKDCFRIRSDGGETLYNIHLLDMTLTINTANADAATNCIGVDMENIAGGTINCDVNLFGICYKLAGCFDIKAIGVTSVMGALTPNGRRIVYVTKATAPYGGAYGGNIHFIGCDLRAGNLAGVSGAAKIVHCDGVDGVFFTGCYFGYAGTVAAHIQRNGTYIAGVKFLGCWFDTAQGNGLIFDGSTGAANGPCSVNDCQFYGGGTTIRNLAIQGDWQHLDINGNILGSATADNILVQTTSGKIKIVGNMLMDADNEGGGGGEGINVANTTGLLIANNYIDGRGLTDNGIAVSGGARVKISGNVVENCITGIYTLGALDDYMVTDNLLQENSFMNLRDTATGVNKVVANNLTT